MKKKVWPVIVILAAVIVLAVVLYPKLMEQYGQPRIELPQQDVKQSESAVTEMEEAEEADVAEETSDIEKKNDTEDPEVAVTEKSEGTEEATRPEAPAAPDFSINDPDGKELKFSEIYDERPMILNFWASWCGPCRSEMPAFQNLYEDYKDRVDFALVNMTDGQRETRALAQEFLDKGEYDFPVYFDEAQSAAYTYAVRFLPTTAIINGEGKIEDIIPGVISEQPFRDFLDAWLESMDDGAATETGKQVD